ncbi:MAG: hypothetical protein PHH00_02560 [Candidatus Nanoarchaeia archaeon]|nr:hypothetical protein [Candidatus Nanoarchaeia archaeon]
MKRGAVFTCIFLLISLAGSVYATAAYSNLHLNIQVTYSNGSIQAGTFNFVFNISSSINCADANIVYSNSTTLTTDSRGIISYYLPNVTLDYQNQYWLCYYKSGVLIDTSELARVPYTFQAKNVTLSGVKPDTNFDMAGYNITTTGTGFFGYLGSLLSRISNLFVQEINATGNITTTGNVTAGYFFGDGSQLTGILTSFSETDPYWAGNYSAYNSSWSSITNTSYYLATNPFLFYNSTTLPATSETLWNANYSTFLTHINWANAVNGTLFTTALYNTNYSANDAIYRSITNTSYYLATNPFLFYNSTTLPASSGGISGVGTYGYVPMWNSTSSMNNSAIYQNGSKIGIGTTTPEMDFHVSSDRSFMVNATAGSTFLRRNTGGGWAMAYKFLGTGGTDLGGFGGWGSNDELTAYYIGRNYTDAAVYITGTSVGIGATSPLSQLDISNAGTNGVDTTNSYRLTTSYANVNENKIYGFRFNRINATGNIATGGYRLDIDRIIRVDNAPSYSTALTIGTSGNFGINTTSPQNTLNVLGDINATGGIYSSGVLVGGSSGVSGIGTYGYIPMWNSTSSINNSVIYQNGSYIGIGTASPLGKLSITDTADTNSLYIESSGNNAGITLNSTQAGGRTFQILSSGGSAAVPSSLRFYDINGGDRMVINSSGYVGIGTTTPEAKLHVQDGAFVLDNTADLGDISNLDVDASGFVYSDADNQALWDFNTSATSSSYSIGRFRILDLDDWGSGEDDSSLLQIIHLGAVDAACDDCATLDIVENGTAQLAIAVRNVVGGTVSFAVKPEGNVGIGTNAPTDMFAQADDLVIGDGSDSKGLTIYAGTSATNYSWVAFGNGTSAANERRGYIAYNFVDDNMYLATKTLNRMVIDGSGNVGIKTITPLSVLHINSTASSAGVIIESNSSQSSSLSPRLGLVDAFSANPASSAPAWFIDNYATDFRIFQKPNITTTSESVALFIESTNNNVGIGTSSPGYKLEVQSPDGANIATYLAQIYNLDVTAGQGNGLRIVAGNGASDTPFYVTNRTGSALLYVGGDGNVGIGIASPLGKLSIEGDSDVSEYDVALIINDTDASSGSRIPSIRFYGGTYGEIARIQAVDTAGIYFKNSTGSTTVNFANTGKVGIGTISPGTALEVTGNVTLSSSRNCILFASGGKICST